MIEVLVLAGVSISAIVGYTLGWGRASDSGGCNGHHWGEPETNYSARDARTADIPDLFEPYTVQYSQGTVVLRRKAVRRCEDCGEVEKTTVQVGRIPREAFENDILLDGIRSAARDR